MSWVIKSVRRFVIAFVGMTILCAVVWQFLGERLYDCTDDNFIGFLCPGQWVHSLPGQPAVKVSRVIHGRSMCEPDTIKEGWSVERLWALWFSFLLTSFLAGIAFSRTTWTPSWRELGVWHARPMRQLAATTANE